MNHDTLCPAGRHKGDLCICDTLCMVRAAERREQRELEQREDEKEENRL